MFTKTTLAVALATAFTLPTAIADTQKQKDESIEEITVLGQRSLLTNAIAAQRAADMVKSVITNDAIGNLPDQNVAEAVRRLAGVNVLNDQGEGRFISVRGLDPELNAASVNGVRLPSPEADSRAVALDVIPSELVESIEVIKSLTPEMDADTIGATIQINTIKATEREDFIKANIAGSYNDLNEEISPELGVDFSHKISNKLGVAGGLKHSIRKTSTDNVEAEGWEETDSGDVYAAAVEYRDYDVERTRTGLSLSFDYNASDDTQLFLRTLYSKFDDEELRRRLVFEMDKAPSATTATTATFDSADGEISVRRGIKDRFESQIIRTIEFGGESKINDWLTDYSISFAHAQEHEYKTQDPTRFRRDFDEAGDLVVAFDYSNLAIPAFNAVSTNFDFNDPSIYVLNKMEEVDGKSEDTENAFQFNAAKNFLLGEGELEFKTGFKYRSKEKTFDVTLTVFEDYADDAYTLADVAGTQSYGLFDLGPLPDLGAVRNFNNTNRANFETVEEDFVEGTLEAFTVEEDVLATYAQGRYEIDNTIITGGVRIEYTDNMMQGNLVDVDAETATAQTFENDYTNVLPSINIKHNATDEVVVRGAIYQSIVRPKMSKLAPKFEINEDFEAAFGNPDLKPYEATNFDASVEYYFAPSAVVQAGIFYKDIENFIVDRVFKADDAPYNGQFNGISFEEAEVPVNGESAEVFGIELAYNQGFDNGLLVGFNYTYTDAEGDLGERKIALPASSEATYNAMLGYEMGPISTRLTMSYRDEYLDEIGGDAQEDRHVKGHTQVDFTASYDINDDMSVYLKLVNITDEPYIAYQKGPQGDRLLQFEEYSFTAKVGLKARF